MVLVHFKEVGVPGPELLRPVTSALVVALEGRKAAPLEAALLETGVLEAALPDDEAGFVAEAAVPEAFLLDDAMAAKEVNAGFVLGFVECE